MFADDMEEDDQGVLATQQPASQQPASQQAAPGTAGKAGAKPGGGASIAAQLALEKGEVVLMLPERVPRNKVRLSANTRQ